MHHNYEWDSTKETLFAGSKLARQRKRISDLIAGARSGRNNNVQGQSPLRFHGLGKVLTPTEKATERLRQRLDVSFRFRDPTTLSETKKLYCILNYKRTRRVDRQKFRGSLISRNENTIEMADGRLNLSAI